MSQLKKIDAHTNVLTWFELPARDLNRARQFYETILDIKMPVRKDGAYEAAFFPYDPAVMQASSGRVTGVIVASQDHTPSMAYTGTVVYINASPELQAVLDRTVAAGGQIIADKNRIPPGWIAKIRDPEGNIVGLFSEL